MHYQTFQNNNMVSTLEDYISEEVMIQRYMEERHLSVEVESKMDEWIHKSISETDQVEMKVDEWLVATEESK